MRTSTESRPVLNEVAGDGGGPLVAMVHPGVFPATVYRRLADDVVGELGTGCDVVVLDLTAVPEYWRATMAGGPPDITIEEIADRFNAELAERAAKAPVTVLVGWSFGGTVAYAMVERGRAARAPELLLLDSIAPAERFPEDMSLARPVLLSWFAKYLGAKRGVPIPLTKNDFATNSVEDGLAMIRDAAAERGAMRADTAVVGLRKLYDTFVDGLVRQTKLTNAYQAPPAPHELTLVKPDGSLRPATPDLGWSAIAAEGITVHGGPGDHYTMLSDPAATEVIAGLIADKTRSMAGR